VWLLPPSVHEFVPPGHPTHLMRELVREELDLAAILEPYEREERGQPPYHPAMMVTLLLYAYSQGLYASRRIARACEERHDVMAVTGMQRPDFRTISDFRQRHLAALAELFGQVLRLCRQAGLVKLGHIALDGTKLKANASKHKAMSYGRMARAEAELAAEVAAWLGRAEREDAADDAAYGADQRGDELPEWVKDKQARRERIRMATTSEKQGLGAHRLHALRKALLCSEPKQEQQAFSAPAGGVAACAPAERCVDSGFCPRTHRML
jgi:transposase